jgi:SAM-dependent methyltransferase
MDEPEEVTRATYDRFADKWSATHEQPITFWQPELERFHRLLPKGKVIEIGTGSGRDAAELAKLGYDYTGVDNSPNLISAARQAYPKFNFLEQSVYKLDFPADHFDGFWAAAILLHLPKKRVRAALRQIHRVLKKGGIGMISLRQGDFEGVRQKIKFGHDDSRYFSYYQIDEFSTILHEAGFDVLRTTSRPEGDEYVWLAFLVKKR